MKKLFDRTCPIFEPPNMTEDEFDAFVRKSKWKEAVTAKETNPHEYCLRKFCVDNEFVRAVKYIRYHGREEIFWAVRYTMLEHRGRKYWTMGSPLHFCPKTGTILINRTINFQIYDKIAPLYEDLDGNGHWEKENRQVQKMLSQFKPPFLDVGCGTGLFLDLIDVAIEDYLGIDPSKRMLDIFKQKHPDHRTRKQQFEIFSPPKRPAFTHANTIVSLFGTPSYIIPSYIKKFRTVYPGAKLFLMFFKREYEVYTHKATGVHPFWWKYTPIALKNRFGVDPFEFGNYNIVSDIKFDLDEILS